MRNYLIIIVIFTIIGCTDEFVVNSTSIEKLENDIRSSQDSRATHSFAQYEELLILLTESKFTVLPINDFRDSIDDNKIIVGMRHDVDCHPFKALKMAKLESNYNLTSSYYILATSDYYGKFNDKEVFRYKCMEEVYKNLYSLGHEIGIHNDLIVVMMTHGIDPFMFNKEELSFYKELGINIYGTVAHGSSLASKTVKNFKIFSDYVEDSIVEYKGVKYDIGEYSLKDYGFEYEANFVNHTKYYSESGGDWGLESEFDQLLEELRKSKPGDRIQILTHPVWWGNN